MLLLLISASQSTGQELDWRAERAKVHLVSQRLSLPCPKVGFGTFAAALAALSMAVLGHFFI